MSVTPAVLATEPSSRNRESKWFSTQRPDRGEEEDGDRDGLWTSRVGAFELIRSAARLSAFARSRGLGGSRPFPSKPEETSRGRSDAVPMESRRVSRWTCGRVPAELDFLAGQSGASVVAIPNSRGILASFRRKLSIDGISEESESSSPSSSSSSSSSLVSSSSSEVPRREWRLRYQRVPRLHPVRCL